MQVQGAAKCVENDYVRDVLWSVRTRTGYIQMRQVRCSRLGQQHQTKSKIQQNQSKYLNAQSSASHERLINNGPLVADLIQGYVYSKI